MAVIPLCRAPQALDTDRTAGISKARAMIAECEVRPPVSVTMPATLALSMVAVMDGVRSWTTMMVPAGRTERSTTSRPSSSARMPVRMSAMSAARRRKTSSSMDRNMFSNIVLVSTSACSAQVPPSIEASMAPVSSGS